MPQRREDRTQYWQQVLEDFLASGLKKEEYAKQHKISRASLYKWSKCLGISLEQSGKNFSSEQESPLTFVEMKELPSSSYVPQVPLKLEVCGRRGMTVKVELTAGWEQVAGLVKALVA